MENKVTMRQILIVVDHVMHVQLVPHVLYEMIVIEALVKMEDVLVSFIITNHYVNCVRIFSNT